MLIQQCIFVNYTLFKATLNPSKITYQQPLYANNVLVQGKEHNIKNVNNAML